MARASEPSVARKGPVRPPGMVGLIAGLITLASAAAVAVISFTPADPSNWIRVGTFWSLLIGIPVSIVLGFAARRGKDRPFGLVGAGLGGLALIALIGMQLAAD